MKRFAILILSIVTAAALCACACTNREPATTPTNDTTPGTQTDKMPTETVTIPVPETNVPDTGVDNDTTPNNSTGSNQNDATGRSVDQFNFPMPGMQ